MIGGFLFEGGCAQSCVRLCLIRSDSFPLLLFASLATAQQPSGQETQPGAPLTVVTQLVNIVTSVVDGQGNFVGGLTDHNFRILDNGAPQPMVFFTGEDLPARVMVMMETSPAVYLIHNQHLVAAYALLDGLAADDQVALVGYDQSPREILKFTADKSALLSSLSGVQYTIGMGELNFYDSISSALDWLGEPRERRALVILTTGLDSSPAPHWDDLVNKLRREDVVIFSVALGGALRPNESPKKTKKNAPPESAADAELRES